MERVFTTYWQRLVATFETWGRPCQPQHLQETPPATPARPSWEMSKHLEALLTEEFRDLVKALRCEGPVEIARELADLMHCGLYIAVKCGIDMDEIVQLVAFANIGKVANSEAVRIDQGGKILKPDGWKPPDIETELRRQGWNPDAAAIAAATETDEVTL